MFYGFLNLLLSAPKRAEVPNSFKEWARLMELATPYIDRLVSRYNVDLDTIDREKYHSWEPDNHVTQPFLDQIQMLWDSIPPGDMFNDEPAMATFLVLYTTRTLVHRYQRENAHLTLGKRSAETGAPIPVTYEEPLDGQATGAEKVRDEQDGRSGAPGDNG